jgi:hypothetical protein
LKACRKRLGLFTAGTDSHGRMDQANHDLICSG